jgi:hypothetical protein
MTIPRSQGIGQFPHHGTGRALLSRPGWTGSAKNFAHVSRLIRLKLVRHKNSTKEVMLHTIWDIMAALP